MASRARSSVVIARHLRKGSIWQSWHSMSEKSIRFRSEDVRNETAFPRPGTGTGTHIGCARERSRLGGGRPSMATCSRCALKPLLSSDSSIADTNEYPTGVCVPLDTPHPWDIKETPQIKDRRNSRNQRLRIHTYARGHPRRASPSVAPTAGTNGHSRIQRLWACTCTHVPILLKRRPGANRQNTRIKTVGFGCRHPKHKTCGPRPAGSEL